MSAQVIKFPNEGRIVRFMPPTQSAELIYLPTIRRDDNDAAAAEIYHQMEESGVFSG